MENIDIQKKVKAKREGTFGTTPEVTKVQERPEPVKQSAVDSIKDAVAKQNKEASQSQPVNANQVKLTKGFTVGIDDKGIARLVPFGNPNFLELVGLMRYTDTKQDDILHDLAMSKEARTLNQVDTLTKNFDVIAQGVSTLLSK